MQRAAREVAWVNERLLELLASKGVERGEVDEYLTKARKRAERVKREDMVASTDIDDESEAQSPCGGTTDTQRAALMHGDRGKVRLRPPAPTSSMPVQGMPETPVHEDGVGDGEAVENNNNNNNNKLIISTSTFTTTRGVKIHPPPALVTSCDDAANIIADFQGHGDPLRARSALGCGDATDCHVKNTTLFQLMDETK